jgi:signal peptidase I
MKAFLRNQAVRRWAFRAAFLASLVGVLVANTVPLVYRLHGERLLVVTSGSMEPRIHAGDAVVIRPLTAPQLRVGQVVTFQAPGSDRYTTHRIIAIERRYLVADPGPDDHEQYFIRTQGDHNLTPDPNLTPIGSIRGIVTETLPGWGRFLTWAHSATGRFVLFAPPLLLLLGAELLSWRKPRRSPHPGKSDAAAVPA